MIDDRKRKRIRKMIGEGKDWEVNMRSSGIEEQKIEEYNI